MRSLLSIIVKKRPDVLLEYRLSLSELKKPTTNTGFEPSPLGQYSEMNGDGCVSLKLQEPQILQPHFPLTGYNVWVIVINLMQAWT